MPEPQAKPKIVCLCGSTKFKDAYEDANFRETMKGRIVLSVGVLKHSTQLSHPITPLQEKRLDELHLRKIDLADSILVLNVGGYIGASTRREIIYAHANGKRVEYLVGAGERGEG